MVLIIVIEAFYKPFLAAFSSVQRRQDIFFAARNQIDEFASVWVASMGHFMALFDQPFVGILPHNKIAMLRYAEFHKIENDRIQETTLFIDLLHLMAQIGLAPIPQQTGIHLVQPDRAHMTACLSQVRTITSQNDEDGAATLALINRMIGDINPLAICQPSKELRQCWHEDMLWWGPTGIGATYTIERYIQQQASTLFRTQNEGRRLFNGLFNGPYLLHGRRALWWVFRLA